MTLLDSARIADSLNAVSIDSDNPACLCSFIEDSWQFDYFHYATGNKTLNVFFPAALVRGKRIVPSFRRWSWAPQFHDADTICVSDPTLRLDPEILGGWFQGKNDDWVLLRTLKHINFLQHKFGYQKILFYGSSLGGFTALQAGILAPSHGFRDVECRVFAENPQVVLPQYMFVSHLKKLAQVSYGVNDFNAIPEEAVLRVDVVRLMRQTGHVPLGLIVIKESDTHHLDIHVNYLRENIPVDQRGRLRFEVIPAAVDSTGHTALEIDDMRRRIVDIYDGSHG